MRTPILIAAVALIAASFSFAQVADFDGDGDVDIRDFAIEQILASGNTDSADESAGGFQTGGFQVSLTCPRTVVVPGGEIEYEISGVLVFQNSAGLALWGANLTVDWIPDEPLPFAIPGPEMCSFVRNKGFTNPPGPEQGYCFNPSGYGGTRSNQDPTILLQIGGGQNTIGNTAPPVYPVGEVVTYVGVQPVILAVGSMSAPDEVGDYAITLSDGFGNLLDSPPPAGPPFPVSATNIGFSPGVCQFTVDSDCNGNQSPDSLDVASGDSADCNDNGVPDECEPVTIAMVEHCVDGPCGLPPCAQPASGDPCCDAADQDNDGDVDLWDYAMLIESMP